VVAEEGDGGGGCVDEEGGNTNNTSKVVCMYMYHIHRMYIMYVYVCDICTYIWQQKRYEQGSVYVYISHA